MKKILIIITTVITFQVDSYSISYARFRAIHKKVLKTYKNLHRSKLKWKVIGRSRWKQPIYYKVFGSGERTVLMVGCIHGDEPSSGMAVVKLAQRLDKMKELKVRVILIPFLNPDGLQRGTRTNAREVDINRNFPSPSWRKTYRKIYNYPGKKPASEPETGVVINAIERYKPALIIQLHQPFNALYPDKNVPHGLIKGMSRLSGMKIARDIGYETPGSMESYTVSLKGNYPMITYELGSIDRMPNYKRIVNSLVFAAKFFEEETLSQKPETLREPPAKNTKKN